MFGSNYFLLIYWLVGVLLPTNFTAPQYGKISSVPDAQESCSFSSSGRNLFFILEPAYQLILEGREHGKKSTLIITVLEETKRIEGIETRIVEERESTNGKLVEISRNFFAFCQQTGSIYYFGEEVDMYKNGKVVGHEGTWIAGGKNRAGVVMPGTVIKGDSYYQENAPGIAMDRAEVISIEEKVPTPAGIFANCLKTKESTPLDLSEKEFKLYAPGIGLVKEENLLLVKYGFVK